MVGSLAAVLYCVGPIERESFRNFGTCFSELEYGMGAGQLGHGEGNSSWKQPSRCEVCCRCCHLDDIRCYLLASFHPKFFSFRMKLRNHQLLLDQMAAFDVRAAKCALPSDRTAIEDQIAALFESKVESPHDASAMKQFAVDDGEAPFQLQFLPRQVRG